MITSDTPRSTAAAEAAREDLRRALERLARLDGGRRLLQLAVRGLERGDAQLDAGCWRRRADAGCLFQHAYWQGAREGAFPADDDARAWVSRVAGERGWPRVIDAIAAFDRLARAGYRTQAGRRVGVGRARLDRRAWQSAVLAMLDDALASSPSVLATTQERVVQ